MPSRKITFNTERLLSLSAMSLSVITLIIFIWQTNLMSRQNYFSILPYLQLSVLDDRADGSYELSLKNHGVGPAILESVVLEYQGERYDLKDFDSEMNRLLVRLHPGLDSVRYTGLGSLNKGIAIPANSTYEFISILHSPGNYAVFKPAMDQLVNNGLRYEIRYKSLQEEHWMIHNDSEGPEKVD